MKFLRDKLGQVPVLQLLGWAGAIVVSITGFLWSQLSDTNSAVDRVKLGQTAIAERVVILETNYVSIKADQSEIKQDLKEVLRRIK